MKKNFKILTAIIITIIIFLILTLINNSTININNIQNFILSAGIYAPLIYIIAFSLVPLTLFPDSLLAILGGSLFGLIKGSIYTLIGALIGSSISFFISRYFGLKLIKNNNNSKLRNIQKLIKNNGFLMILLLRLIPLFPFDLISYGAGLTKINFKDFFLGTFIGTIPGIIVFVNLGSQCIELNKTSIYLSITLLILFILFSVVLKNAYIKKHIDKNDFS